MLRIEIGSVYMLHFAGRALGPTRRDAEHRAGRGAALTRVAVEQLDLWDPFAPSRAGPSGPAQRAVPGSYRHRRDTPHRGRADTIEKPLRPTE